MKPSRDAEVGLRGHRIQNVERAETRRRDILLTAARVFGREGGAAATLDDVATAMSVSKGVIYYYFRGKEEIYTEIVATAVRESTARLEAIIARGDPPAEMLRAAVSDLVGHIFDELDRFAMQRGRDIPTGPENRAAIRGLRNRYQRLMRGIVEQGIKAGVFSDRDSTLMTFTLLQACLGVSDWYRPGGRLTPAIIAAQVTDQVMAGVLQSKTEGPDDARSSPEQECDAND